MATTEETVWRRLTRLFRSGPVVRHKIANGEKIQEPQGTARAFKKELSSLYVRALASYANYERLSRYCFTGDTLIPTNLPEAEVRLDELVRRHAAGERFNTFSYDKDSGEVVLSTITHAFSTGVREICEVEFDDGNVVRCTPDHRFMLRDGSYEEVGKLSPGTALMPFYRKDWNGYRNVYCFKRGWVSEHVLVAEAKEGRRFDRDCGWHIHHENFCKGDNRFENLTAMPASEHLALHQRINNRRFEDPANRERQADVARGRWAEGGDLRNRQQAGTLVSEEGLARRREGITRFNKENKPGRGNKGRQDQKGSQNANADRSFTFQMICDAFVPGKTTLPELCLKLNVSAFKVKKRLQWEGYSSWESFASTYTNHKIKEVRRTGQLEEVYDLTVEKYHNFGIIGAPSSSICFVSNSDYNEMEYCVSGDTQIAIPGGYKTIRELAEEHGEGEFLVFSYDHSRGRIVPAVGKHARKTRTNEMTYRVTFDNGKEIIGTMDHRLMLRDGSYKKIIDLEIGDRMMPFRRAKGLLLDRRPYETDENLYAMYYDGSKWVQEHREIASLMVNRELTADEVVHHVNEVKWDNRLLNLEVMTRSEHSAHHLREFNRKKWSDMDWVEAFRANHSQFMTEHNPAERLDITFARVLQVAEACAFQMNVVMERLDIDHLMVYRRLNQNGFADWTQFAQAYSPGWKNSSWDNQGSKNPRWKGEVTFQRVCEAHRPGISPGELVAAVGTTRSVVWKRVTQAGFKNISDFCKNYQNCTVVSVEPHLEMDVYDLTVEGYKNFATDSVISHNTPELHSTLDIYADEATVKNDEGDVIEITSPDPEIKETLERLFFDILNINFNAWSWMRHFCKFGDFVLFVDADERHGILNLIPIPINEIEREEGYDPKDPMAVRFRWLTRGNTILENWQVIHFRLLGNDAYLPYGSSVLEPARRIWRQLILIEDAMLVYRIVRSPERRVFHIEIANTPPDKVDAFMEQVRTQLKRNTITDPQTGRVDLRYNPLSVEEDYILPKRGEQKSEITTLPGGQFPVRRDTPVPLLDGRLLTIEELAAEYDAGKENWVYSVQDGTGAVVPGKVAWCGRNYACDRIHRVWLDDGTYVDMAPEHPIVMRDGSKKRADEVMPGDSVMPFRRRKARLGVSEYWQVQDTADGEWKFVHRLFAPHDIGEAMSRSGERHCVIHHRDFDPLNNRPDNLVWMGRTEHIRFHGENALANLHTPEMDERNREWIIQFNRSERGRSMTRDRNSRRWEDESFRKAHSGDNHWNVKKWRGLYDAIPPAALADFCLQNGIRSFKDLLGHADRPLKTDEQVRACLRHHGISSWTEFARTHLQIPPANHKILRVEVIEGVVDDVFCMTVVGPNGEDDRHNFAAGARSLDGQAVQSFIIVSNTGDIEDVQYIQSKMFAAVKVPRAYLGYEDMLGSKATLAQEDVRFAKTIERIQSLFVSELNKIAIIHLFLIGHSGEDLVEFNIAMANPSTVAAQQRLELWRMKLEVAGMAQEGVFDRGFIYRKIFALNDKQIAAIKDGKRIDKLEDTLLQSIEAPPTAEVPGTEGPPPSPEEQPQAGAGELPSTLGGEAGGEAPPPEGGPPPENAGFVPPGGIVSEKFNRGSAGSRAEVSVDRGKDLFSTGESPLALSFGTEKQTASDPNDRRAARRLVTRPFSEADEMPGMDEIDAVEEMLESYARALAASGRHGRTIKA